MFGAIAGDVIGSVYEFNNVKQEDFPLFSKGTTFTDDTVLTIAVADCLISGKEYIKAFKEYGRKYYYLGFGGMFSQWMYSDKTEPYNSYGNGSAMRVSPIGFAFHTLDETLKEARKSAIVTHNHPEGIKGAEAVAAAIYLARQGNSKDNIQKYIESNYGYNLKITLHEIRPVYYFDETCPGTVPQAIRAFLESNSFEDAICKAISIGGDSDTIACITGGIAQAFYQSIPEPIITQVRRILPNEFIEIVDQFNERYHITL